MTSNVEGNSKKYKNIAESIMLYHVSSLPEKINVTTKGLVNKVNDISAESADVFQNRCS